MKKSGPAFRQQKVALARCDECKGRGVVKPMFYEMACVTCHASGIVDKDTGEGLPLADLVLQLRIRLNEKSEENRQLREQLSRTTSRARGHGPMGQTYHGD